MTDISFLLIIFFIVAAVFFADKGLFLILPKKNEKPLQLKPDEVIEIKLGRTGLTLLDGRKVSLSLLEKTVKQRLSVNPGLVVVLEVNGGVKYQRVLSVIEEAKKGGAKKFSIISVMKKPVPVEVGDKKK
ncbi:MAG: biopolymer transporter ExbD [Spirochaetes bacterium]|nr:biopolymer transporter ExbD [Spirochaetota bacterium]